MTVAAVETPSEHATNDGETDVAIAMTPEYAFDADEVKVMCMLEPVDVKLAGTTEPENARKRVSCDVVPSKTENISEFDSVRKDTKLSLTI